MKSRILSSTRLRALLGAWAACAAVAAEASSTAAPPPVEVLHWWTSTSESQALEVVKQGLAARGFQWQDSSVEGGDDRKRQIARARQGKEALPDVLQLQGRSLTEGPTAFLSLESLAAEQRWDALVPQAVRQAARIDGQWMAAPINVHRSNWLWLNQRLFDAWQVPLPTSFASLVTAARRLRSHGVQPFAFGGEPWQQGILFDDAVLSVGGARYYREALLELRPAALSDRRMTRAFEQLALLREFTDRDSEGRPWNFATSMVAHDKAAMQFTGDWAKGEFKRLGMSPGHGLTCLPYPGTADAFVLVADLFASPRRDAARQAGQRAFAATLMDADVQRRFNLEKGSIPVRRDVSLEGFDACALRAAADLHAAEARGSVVSRFASAVPDAVRNAMIATIADFFAGTQSPTEGAAALARAVRVAGAAGGN